MTERYIRLTFRPRNAILYGVGDKLECPQEDLSGLLVQRIAQLYTQGFTLFSAEDSGDLLPYNPGDPDV